MFMSSTRMEAMASPDNSPQNTEQVPSLEGVDRVSGEIRMEVAAALIDTMKSHGFTFSPDEHGYVHPAHPGALVRTKGSVFHVEATNVPRDVYAALETNSQAPRTEESELPAHPPIGRESV